MKWEHKIGIGITCLFLCLIGAVIGLKMQEKTPLPTPKIPDDPVAAASPTLETKAPISFNNNPEMPPLDPRSPASHGNTSGEPPRTGPLADNTPTPSPANGSPTGNKKTDENLSSGRNTMQSGGGGDPTLGVGTRENANAAPSSKGGIPIQSGASKNTPPARTSQPLAVEMNPTAPPVLGAGQWGTTSSQSTDKNQNAAPGVPKGDPKPASPSLPPFPDAKRQPTNQAAPSMIVPASNMEPVLAPVESPIKPNPAPPAPPAAPPSTSPGVGSPPPPAAVNPTNSAAPSPQPAMPWSISQPSPNTPKPLDPKAKDKPLSPVPARAPDMPSPIAPPTLTPSPAVNPAIVPATPVAPAPLPAGNSPLAPPPAGSPPPVPAPTAAPPLAPLPTPVVIPGPGSTPTPASPAAPPEPPKPPAEGSSFIPDNPPTATGPVGVRPAPLPLPVMPPSSPLAATPAPRPASTGASVTVYEEQDYSCRPSDTWEGISKQFYMSDRYAKALQRHNQNHARASDQMKDNGQLTLGQRVFIPQAYVLEERYADAIPKPAAAPASTTMPATFVAPSGSPPPPAPPVPPAPLPAGNGSVPPRP